MPIASASAWPTMAIATRYDKLAKTFFAAVHLVAAFLLIRNS